MDCQDMMDGCSLPGESSKVEKGVSGLLSAGRGSQDGVRAPGLTADGGAAH